MGDSAWQTGYAGVDTSTMGRYEIKYEVMDAIGIGAVPIIREVEVGYRCHLEWQPTDTVPMRKHRSIDTDQKPEIVDMTIEFQNTLTESVTVMPAARKLEPGNSRIQAATNRYKYTLNPLETRALKFPGYVMPQNYDPRRRTTEGWWIMAETTTGQEPLRMNNMKYTNATWPHKDLSKRVITKTDSAGNTSRDIDISAYRMAALSNQRAIHNAISVEMMLDSHHRTTEGTPWPQRYRIHGHDEWKYIEAITDSSDSTATPYAFPSQFPTQTLTALSGYYYITADASEPGANGEFNPDATEIAEGGMLDLDIRGNAF
jgi:hypothetical protein